jgi:hypothetical protein
VGKLRFINQPTIGHPGSSSSYGFSNHAVHLLLVLMAP